MLDIKNMNDNEIINLIELLKHELETRVPKSKFLCPYGEIKLTLESSITNEKGQRMKNEPKTIQFKTMNPNEIEDIIKQDEFYPILVNQLVEKFKEGMWENQSGPLRFTYEDKAHLQAIIYRIQAYCPQISPEDLELLNKISKMLGGK